MRYFSNSFSLNMLSAETFARTTIEVFDFDRLREDCHGPGGNNRVCEFCYDCTPIMYAKLFLKENHISCIGHEDTANILSDLLGIPVPFSRREIRLVPGDELLYTQYVGPRLPGSEFARIKFQKISIFSKEQLELEARHILGTSKGFKVIEILNAD
jgi:hypothetical protein